MAMVLGLPIPPTVEFEEPGQYTICLLCNDNIIAEEQILLKKER